MGIPYQKALFIIRQTVGSRKRSVISSFTAGGGLALCEFSHSTNLHNPLPVPSWLLLPRTARATQS